MTSRVSSNSADPEVRILVVEDDKLVRDYVLTQLHSLGYVTLDAANAAEALAVCAAGHEFDLLFTDVIMPGAMNGRQLANELQRRKPGLKVLFITGYAETAVVGPVGVHEDLEPVQGPGFAGLVGGLRFAGTLLAEQRDGLLSCEERDERPLEALLGDGEHALDGGQGGWIAVGRIAQEGTDGDQAEVASGRRRNDS